MSPGKKMRALTATSAIKNKSVTISGAIYWRQKAMAKKVRVEAKGLKSSFHLTALTCASQGELPIKATRPVPGLSSQ